MPLHATRSSFLPLLLGPLLLLSACSDPVETAREQVTAALNMRGEYQVLDATLHGDGVVCGHFQMMGKWGEQGRKEAYVYVDDEPRLYATADEVAVFCSDSPAAAVEERFGIALKGEGATAIRQVARDLGALSGALERYYEAQGNYPSTLQGLEALHEKPSGRPAPSASYPEGGYLAEVPVDPWGQPYHYSGPVWAGVKSPFQLWTNGADKARGGNGPGTDITIEMLPFLEYALR